MRLHQRRAVVGVGSQHTDRLVHREPLLDLCDALVDPAFLHVGPALGDEGGAEPEVELLLGRDRDAAVGELEDARHVAAVAREVCREAQRPREPRGVRGRVGDRQHLVAECACAVGEAEHPERPHVEGERVDPGIVAVLPDERAETLRLVPLPRPGQLLAGARELPPVEGVDAGGPARREEDHGVGGALGEPLELDEELRARVAVAARDVHVPEPGQDRERDVLTQLVREGERAVERHRDLGYGESA